MKNTEVRSGFARVLGAQPALPQAHIVPVECDIAKGLHAFAIVGLPDKAVEEAKDRVASAVKNTEGKLESPKRSNKKIVISLAPADLKKEGAAFDLPIALSYLLASGQVRFDPGHMLFAGELSLDGRVRPIRGALSIAVAAREHGISDLFLPEDNAAEASLVSGISIFPVRTLAEALAHLDEKNAFVIGQAKRQAPARVRGGGASIDDIRGQENAKRGLEIAAAGRHNIALYGPPGTGKTMLARAAADLLPPLSEPEAIEVTCIHSLAGTLSEPAMLQAPFRAPHHTSSYASLIGGGTIPRPGEVTLAHRGVLFADEFPEFHRDVINALREPLEDHVVSISRAKGQAVFPASFMFIAALNPCPCGHFGTPRCECPAHAVERYRRKVSGPVADRIDMWVHVGDMPPEALTGKRRMTNEASQARERVEKARRMQRERFSATEGATVNADMQPKHIEAHAMLTKQAEEALVAAAHRLHLSARGYHRSIKLARTIADLSGAVWIEPAHMLEALQYRAREL